MKIVCLCNQEFDTGEGLWCLPNHVKPDGTVCPGSFIMGAPGFINMSMSTALLDFHPEEITGWRVPGQRGIA